MQPALPRDNLIPQLSGIHLEADAERKEVTATARSTALAARISFPSKVEEAGSAVINGTLLCQLMEKFSGEDVYKRQPYSRGPNAREEFFALNVRKLDRRLSAKQQEEWENIYALSLIHI